jgi:hypothetical protein
MADFLLGAFIYQPIMLFGIVAAAFLASSAESRLKSDIRTAGDWWWQLIFVYGLPFLLLFWLTRFVVGFWGYHFYLKDYTSCGSAANCAHLRESFIFTSQIGTGVQLLGFALMGLLLWVRTRGSSTGGQPDPRKWHFDKETGEYYRILRFHKGHPVVDRSTYAEQIDEEVERAYLVRTTWVQIMMALIAGFLIVLFFYYESGNNYSPILALGIGAVGGLSVIILLLMSFKTWNDGVAHQVLRPVGPPPVAPPGRAEVERQKVHGSGRMMTRDEMDRALRSGERAPARRQTFED